MADDPKKLLRAKIRAKLTAMKPDDQALKSAKIAVRFAASAEFERAKTVMLYDSMGSEVETRGLVKLCLAHGKKVCLPRIEAKPATMRAHVIDKLDGDMETTLLGFRQPLAICPEMPPEEIDLIVTPGLAFDAQGNRLGRGVGYYDRFLSKPELRAALVALAFECQIVPDVPHEAHDRAVQVIFTEARVIRRIQNPESRIQNSGS